MKKYLKESWNNIYDKAEEFVNSALEAGASKKTAQSFFDDAWNKAEDNEDWIWESKKSNRKSIRETNDTLAGNNYKDVYADQSNDIGYDYQYDKEQSWINSYPYSAFDYPFQFVGNLNKFLPSGVTAKIGDKIKATPYNGKGFKVEVEDDQSSDKLNKVFEIHFTYESDVDEIQVAAIFKPHRDANVIQTWITRDTTWEELSDELVSKIWENR